MSKFALVNYFSWMWREFKKPSKTYQGIFRKSWIFILFLISILAIVRLIEYSLIWAILIILIIEFFNWLMGKHD